MTTTRTTKTRSGRSTKGLKIAIILLIIVFVAEAIGGFFYINSKADKVASDTTGQTTNPDVTDKTKGASSTDRIVMTINGSHDTYVLRGEEYVEGYCHAVDLDEGDITASIEIKGSVNADKAGDYTITYTATNSQKQSASCERVVHVVDDMAKNTVGVPVLMYHYVYTADDMPDELDANYIEDVELEEQLQYLTSNNYYYPSYQELSEYIAGRHSLPEKSVFLTFDDGEGGFLDYGVPLLEKYGVFATSFLVTWDNAGPATRYPSPYITYQTHSEDMHRGGGNIGHGGRISAMSQQEIYDDLKMSTDKLGTKEAFAYPFGDHTDTASAAIRELGILCAFTTEYGLVNVGDDPTTLTRIRVTGGAGLDRYVGSLS
ncbi:MAG: DUF5011 domain-containing protein [Eggerthellaceae bacterium]|nr:DUF5011 domain-containing protein [Eggerthellaceae bacterium]